MERFESMPRNAVEGWPLQNVTHPPLEQVAFHYHTVEEWLEVKRGALSFVAPGGLEIRVAAGQSLRIPPGEVHRVDIGPEGTTYDMWTPRVERTHPFAHPVSDELLALIRDNLMLPEVENRWDRRNRDQPTSQDHEDEVFFRELLSAALIFRTAAGGYLDLGRYLRRPPPNPASARASSGSVQVLSEAADTILLSTAVQTTGPDGRVRSFANLRLFAIEEDRWKCRAWINSPEPGSP
jgi:quercetin dioxygenase-like cupin family protein